MDRNNKYHQIERTERIQIYALQKAGLKVDAIALQLGRHRSTLYRELSRNRCYYYGREKQHSGYLPNLADAAAKKRRSRDLKLMQDAKLKELIINYLKKGWSPEQIAGRLKKESGYTVISHETIYAYIYDRRALDERLYLHLSRKRRYRKPRVSRNHRKGPIANRIDISERSEEIASRETFGHWEGDLILFKDTRSNLITLRERKSRFMFGLLNPSKEAEPTSKAIIKYFEAKKPGLITTLTVDNGGEFARHESITKALNIDIFFCKPYASYEKGTIENGNRQLRRDLPRETMIDEYTQEQIDAIVNQVNNRPLKILGYKTPAEVLLECYGEALNGVVAVGD